MRVLKRFTFWLPLFSFAFILFELIYQPAKHLAFAGIDPIFAFLFSFLRLFLPDNQSIYFGLALHFLLAVCYGLLLDRYLPKLKD